MQILVAVIAGILTAAGLGVFFVFLVENVMATEKSATERLSDAAGANASPVESRLA